mgnify:CR=1 FL=1
MSVSMSPGATLLTVMARFASSPGQRRVAP